LSIERGSILANLSPIEIFDALTITALDISLGAPLTVIADTSNTGDQASK
jgi:hypothetical protein